MSFTELQPLPASSPTHAPTDERRVVPLDDGIAGVTLQAALQAKPFKLVRLSCSRLATMSEQQSADDCGGGVPF